MRCSCCFHESRQTADRELKVDNHDSWSLPLDLRTKRAPASKGFGGLVPSSMEWERPASISSSSSSLALHPKSNAQYLIWNYGFPVLISTDTERWWMWRVPWGRRLVQVHIDQDFDKTIQSRSFHPNWVALFS